MSREEILGTIRSALASRRDWLKHEAAQAGHTPPPYVLPPVDDLVAQFADELRKLEGRVYVVDDDETAIEQIAELLAERDADRIAAWDLDAIGLPGLGEMLSQRGVEQLATDVRGEGRKDGLQVLEPAAVCISGADVGIAESGTLLLRHGPGRPRLASLLAPAHVAVLREDQLVRGLGEAMSRIRAAHGERMLLDSSNLTLITGPSRTADIEMTLSLGIHGPPQIHVVLIRAAR